ncbi:hypothetical protein [Bacillus norwichensis]|nr:hypothetical protein [Bacillus norwichensis]
MRINLNINPATKEDEITIAIKEMNEKVERILSIINENGASGVIP